MNVKEAIQRLQQSLREIYDEGEASAITALAIEHITGLDRTGQLVHKERELDVDQVHQMQTIAKRLLQEEPIQYVTGRAFFYDMEIYVDRDVLIPRPETEELVHWIIYDVKKEGLPVFTNEGADKTSLLKILDVGTGSGCIALALKKAMPLAEVWGCDISDRALNVARRNGAQLDIRVDFQSVDYLNPLQQKHLPSVDILVSNPPYIPRRDEKEMRPNVLQYEPHTALFVKDENPLLFYRALIDFAGHRLHEGGRIYAEIHEEKGTDVVELFQRKGFHTELRTDMQGKQRMVKATMR